MSNDWTSALEDDEDAANWAALEIEERELERLARETPWKVQLGDAMPALLAREFEAMPAGTSPEYMVRTFVMAMFRAYGKPVARPLFKVAVRGPWPSETQRKTDVMATVKRSLKAEGQPDGTAYLRDMFYGLDAPKEAARRRLNRAGKRRVTPPA